MAESKEIKAFSKERQALDELYDVAGNIKDLKEDYTILKKILLEYESIKSAEPTKALECLENFIDECQTEMYNYAELQNGYQYEKWQYRKEQLENIKQALMSKSNAERCWEIVVKKRVSIVYLEDSLDVEQYNEFAFQTNGYASQLTEEEFNLLKNEVGKCQK